MNTMKTQVLISGACFLVAFALGRSCVTKQTARPAPPQQHVIVNASPTRDWFDELASMTPADAQAEIDLQRDALRAYYIHAQREQWLRLRQQIIDANLAQQHIITERSQGYRPVYNIVVD